MINARALALGALGVVISAGALWATFRGADPREVLRAVQDVEARAVLAYLGLLVAVHLVRTLRWRLLLPAGAAVRFGRLNAAAAVGSTLQLVLPLRLGEVARPALIAQGGAVPFSAALSSIVTERIVDGLFVALGLTCLLMIVPQTDHVVLARVAGLTVGAAFAALVVALAVAHRSRGLSTRLLARLERFRPTAAARAREALRGFFEGLTAAARPGRLAGVLILTVAYWVLSAAAVLVLAQAYGLGPSPLTAALVVCANVVGMMIPSAPGMVGTSQAATLAGLALAPPANLDPLGGVALANALWAGQMVFHVVIGLVFLPACGRVVWRPPREDEPASSRSLPDEPRGA